MANRIKIVAAGFIILGVIAMVGPSFGFATIAADRPMSVTTADDPYGLLGIDIVYGGDEIWYDDGGSGSANEEVVLRLENNFGDDIDFLDVQIASIDGVDDSTLVIENRQDLFDGIESGEGPADVILECSRDVAAQSDGTAVTFQIDATSSSIAVTEKTVVVTDVRFDCDEDDVDRVDQEPGIPSDEVDDIDFDSTSDAFVFDDYGVEFTFTNAGDDPLTITALEIRDTSVDVAVGLDNGGNNEVEIDSDGQTGAINAGGGNQQLRFGDGGVELDQPVTVASGSSATTTMQDFEEADSGRDRLNMEGEDVYVVLYFDGGQDAVMFELTDLQPE